MPISINVTDLSQQALLAGIRSLPDMRQFSTSVVTDSTLVMGDGRMVPVYSGTGIADYNDSTNNYETENGSLPTVPVTFNKRKKATIAVDDIMRSRFSFEDWLAVQVPTLCRGVMADVLSLVTAANYGAPGTGLSGLASASAFGLAEIAKAKNVGDLASPQWNDQRSLWLNYDWYNTFAGTFSAYLSGGSVLLDGGLGNKLGIQLNAAAIPVNGEKLVGFCCDRSAVALGFMSVPVSEEGSELVDFAVATDPTGVTFMVGLHYRTATRKTYCTVETIYGFAKGTGNLTRITSA